MGGAHDWFMVEAIISTVPVGPLAVPALVKASAKQVCPTKFPFTQATSKINGQRSVLVSDSISELPKLVVTQ